MNYSIIGPWDKTSEASAELRPPRDYAPSQGSPLGFAILIILGIGGLAIAGAGLAVFGGHQGFWHAGALSQLSQVNGLILMGAGGAGGLISLVLGSLAYARRNLERVRASSKGWRAPEF